MTVRVPDDMSSVDAFDALYKNATVFGMGQYAPSSGDSPTSPWNTIQVFKSYCHRGQCDYVRGKYMKVDFLNFPELDVNNYDQHYGEGSAQKAIDTYRKTMNESDSKEKYDLHCEPCRYFTSDWKHRTPEHHRKDLNEMFSRCDRLEEAEERAQKQINEANSNSVFHECKAKYALVTPPIGYIHHDYMTCQEAIDHFKMLLQSERPGDLYVKKLTVCRSRREPFLQSCQKENSEIFLDTARKIVESQMPKE